MRWIFWGFCRNWFLIDPVHYLLSRSNFGFKFAEIFVTEKRLADSASRRLSNSAGRESMSRRVAESALECLKQNSASRRVSDSSTRRVGVSLTPRLRESDSRQLPDSANRGVAMESLFKFFKIYHRITAL
jgi:hypothetical protein